MTPTKPLPSGRAWQKLVGGKAPAEFMSDHPSDQRRIGDLQKEMPEAQKYYASARR